MFAQKAFIRVLTAFLAFALQGKAHLEQAPPRSPWLAAIVVTGLAGATLLGWFAFSSSESAIGTPRPLETSGGLSAPGARQVVDAPCRGAPSANGRWIACVEDFAHLRARGEELPAPLVLFSPDTGEWQSLVQPPADARIGSVVLSPAGDRVVYTMSGRDRPLEIRHQRIADRSDRLLGHLPPDGSDLILNQWLASDGMVDGRLWRNNDSQAYALLSPDVGVVDAAFEFTNPPQGFSRSPDGRFLALDMRQADDQPERDIQVCELALGTCAVLAHPAHDFFPVWAPDGRLFFDSDRAGTMGLWAVELDGLREAASPVQLQDTGRARVIPFGFTSDGTLFHDLRLGFFDIYATELDAGTDSQPALVRLSPRAVDTNKSAVWSADGRWLAYVSQRGPFPERGALRVVVQSTSDGVERAFPYDGRLNMSRLAWSPDGSTLALRGLMGGVPPEGVFGIHLIDVRDGRVVRTLTRFQPPERSFDGQVGDLAWTDDATIVFSSLGGVGAFNIATGEESPVWAAPPGQQVYALALSPDRLWLGITVVDAERPSWTAAVVVPSDGGVARELLRTTRDDLAVVQDWTADGLALLASRADLAMPMESRFWRLWKIPTDGSAAEPLPIELLGLNEVRAHPDGRRITFTAGQPRREFWITTGLN